MSGEDLYAVLGVAKDANADDIKKAYRKLARRYHPDRNQGDAAAEERFKQVSHAHDVLSDQTKRREYDAARAFGGRMPPAEGTRSVVLTPLGLVRQHVMGVGDLLKALFRRRIALITIRVVPTCELPICLLDVVCVGVFRDTEHRIEILAGHPPTAALARAGGRGCRCDDDLGGSHQFRVGAIALLDDLDDDTLAVVERRHRRDRVMDI